MKAACGVEYPEASHEVSHISIQDVLIPFANPHLRLLNKNQDQAAP
jgi:hypothetical protein